MSVSSQTSDDEQNNSIDLLTLTEFVFGGACLALTSALVTVVLTQPVTSGVASLLTFTAAVSFIASVVSIDMATWPRFD